MEGKRLDRSEKSWSAYSSSGMGTSEGTIPPHFKSPDLFRKQKNQSQSEEDLKRNQQSSSPSLIEQNISCSTHNARLTNLGNSRIIEFIPIEGNKYHHNKEEKITEY